jgi:hypothetical protein
LADEAPAGRAKAATWPLADSRLVRERGSDLFTFCVSASVDFEL